MKKKKLWIGVGIAVVIGLVVGINILRSGQETGMVAQVFQVKEGKIEEKILASGKVEVVKKEDINARTNAMVQEVLVNGGDRVKRGQVLVKLDTDQLTRDLKREEANLAVQKASLAKTKATARPQEVEQDKAALKRAEVVFSTTKTKYQRTQVLFQEGAISQEELESAYKEYIAAETEYRSAQQRLSLRLAGETGETIRAQEAMVKQAEVSANLAREQLAGAAVKASMDGVVLALEVEKGQYVNTGTPLATIGDLGRLQVEADINESDSGQLVLGQPVKITSSAVPGEEFAGEISQVGAAAVTKVKSGGEQTEVPVTVSVTRFDAKLKPGYTVDLTITTASKSKALFVPYEAVIEKNKIKEVFVVEKGKAKKRQVQTGIGNELYLTVEKGLRRGDKVVVNPSEKLKDGSVVKETPYQGDTGKGD